MNPHIETAFQFPGAIIMRNDLSGFRDPEGVTYEVAIQHPRVHRRFANFFIHKDIFVMYVKHDPTVIADLYKFYHHALLPSDVAPKYWSKLLIEREPDLVQPLLETSYTLIRSRATKQAERLILKSGAQPNRFLIFHEAALALAQRANVYLNYFDYEVPSLHVGLQPRVKFEWNTLYLRRDDIGWQTCGPERYMEWPNLMESAVSW